MQTNEDDYKIRKHDEMREEERHRIKGDTTTYGINEVAKELGVSRRTIERWEKLKWVKRAKRDYKNWRVYNREDIDALHKFKDTLTESTQES